MFSSPPARSALSSSAHGVGAAALNAPNAKHGDGKSSRADAFSSMLADASQDDTEKTASDDLPASGEGLPDDLPPSSSADLLNAAMMQAAPAAETDDADAAISLDRLDVDMMVLMADAEQTTVPSDGVSVIAAPDENSPADETLIMTPAMMAAALAMEHKAAAANGERASAGTQAALAAPEGEVTDAASTPANPRLAELVEMLRAAPQTNNPAEQAWLRATLQRMETALNAQAGADFDADTALGRFNAGGDVGATLAALLRGDSQSSLNNFQARAELAQSWRQHAEQTVSTQAATPAAAPGITASSALAGGERAAPMWSMATPLQQSAQWGEEVGERVRWMASQNIQSAELKITPANLGTIEIRISMNKDQMQVAFSTPHAAVREALEEAAPRLREMLSANGFNSVNVDVSQHAPSRQHERGDDHGHFAARDTQREPGDAPIAEGEMRIAPMRALGAIDFYA
jgi:flagellar hook-length control protein FliK